MTLFKFCLLLLLGLLLQYILPQLWPPLLYVDFSILLVFQTARLTSIPGAIGYGWLAGLVQDLTISASYPTLLQATSKMTIAFLTGLAARVLNMDHPGIQSLLFFLLMILNHTIVMVFFPIFGRTCPASNLLPVVFGSAFTTLLNFPLWFFVTRYKQTRPY